MRKKFLILTLCFTLVFSSINLKRSYADAGVISLPILATVSSLAVGTGLAIKSSDDLYDLGRMFYDYIDKHNDLTWSTVQALFATGVSLHPNKLVSVDSNFLDIVKEFFDFNFGYDSFGGYLYGLPVLKSYDYTSIDHNLIPGSAYPLDDTDIILSDNVKFVFNRNAGAGAYYNLYLNGVNTGDNLVVRRYCYKCSNYFEGVVFASYLDKLYGISFVCDNGHNSQGWHTSGISVSGLGSYLDDISFPYDGGYIWDNVESKKENGSVALPIPGDLGQLVGQDSTDFWDNTDLVGNGSLSIPSVSNPSISVDTTVDSFQGSTDTDVPGTGTVPSLPSLPSWGSGLDFSPITQGVFVDKFPFCLAKDISDILSVFDSPSKDPIFKVPLVSEEITLDMTEFKLWFDIIKFFILIGFIISLIVLTRGIIG